MTAPLRLVFVEQVPRFIGGSERMSLSLCRHAISRGHEAWLVHQGDGDMVAAYARAGARCRQLPVLPVTARRPAEVWRSFTQLRRLARRERIDTLFTSQVNYLSLLTAVGATTGARTVVHLGLVYDFPSPIFRASMRAVDLGVAPSDRMAHDWIDHGWPAAAIRVIPNGVDDVTFSPGDGRVAARQRIGVSADSSLVAYVGRLVGAKGIFTLVRAFGSYRRAGGTARLMLAGFAPADEVRELAELGRREDLREDAWEIRPATSTPEDLYRAADVVVVPSEWDEPFGLAPLEAAACGTLTIVSDRGLMPTFVAAVGEHAVFPSGNVEALTARLSFWLADRTRRETAADGLMRDVGRRFAFASCGDAYLSAMESLRAT